MAYVGEEEPPAAGIPDGLALINPYLRTGRPASMAALLGQGARRIGGSLLQQTQAALTSPAVSEERRRLLVPSRRMYSTQQQAEVMQMQKQKEELYEALCKADLPMVEKWRNKRLLRNLAVHINPRKHDIQWQWLRASKWFSNVVMAAGSVSFACIPVVGWEYVKEMKYSYVKEMKKVLLIMKMLQKEYEEKQEQ